MRHGWTGYVWIIALMSLVLVAGCTQLINGPINGPAVTSTITKERHQYLDPAAATPENLKRILTPYEYDIVVDKGTEQPFTGDLLHNDKKGVYVTAGCGIPVFSSDTKFDSGTGWPSFYAPIDNNSIVLKEDYSLGIPRTEVLSRCGEHLGHVFDDGPPPTGKRYCINSAALDFIENDSQ